MSSKSTKAKRKAIPGITLQELVDTGVVDEFCHLRDTVDIPFQMTRHAYLPELPKRPKDGRHASDGTTIGKKPDGRP